MALKITGRASGIPGGQATPSSGRTAVRSGLASRPPLDPTGALKTRLSLATTMAPQSASAAKLRHATRSATPPDAAVTSPPATLAAPTLKPRRRPQLGTGATGHPDDEQELSELDEPRADSETDKPQESARPRSGGGLPFGALATPREAAPPTRANGAQSVKLQLGALSAIGSSRRSTANGPRIDRDNNSFMDSLVHAAAAMLRRNIALPASEPLNAATLRRHMAFHMIDVFTARNAAKERAGEAYGENAGADAYNFARPEVQRHFEQALGTQQAARCAGFSAAQKSQLLDMAADRPALLGPRRTLAFAAILPQVATDAFAGLRLEVGMRGREPVAYGSGDGPVHALAFDALSGRYAAAVAA